MKISQRITRLNWVTGTGLFASTVDGYLLHLDDDFNVLRSVQVLDASAPQGHRAIYALESDGDYLYTRNKRGTIAKTSLTSFSVISTLSAEHTCNRETLVDGEEPSPTIVRGFGIKNGFGYYSNGYFQLAKVNLSTFEYEIEKESIFTDHKIDSISTNGPHDVVSDREGFLTFCDLESRKVFKTIKLDDGNIHKVLWDPFTNSYWVTLDAGFGDSKSHTNGLARLTESGEVVGEWLGARNDIETVAQSNDGRYVVFGGFDNVLHVADATLKGIKIVREITGFTHQIIDCVISDDNEVVVLTQDGELVKISFSGALNKAAGYRRSCVWDISFEPERSELILATDAGVETAYIDVKGESIPQIRREYVATPGFARRVYAENSTTSFHVSWPNFAIRIDDQKITWIREVGRILYDIRLSGSKIFCATIDGITELDKKSGKIGQNFTFEDKPIWTIADSTQDPEMLIAASRTGELFKFSKGSGKVFSQSTIDGYPKRAIRAGAENRLYFTGGGGVKEYSETTNRVTQAYSEHLDNTIENAARVGPYMACVSYGMQTALYEYTSGEPVALDETLPDFAKSIAKLDETHFLVGGRGGYVRLYRIISHRSENFSETVSLQILGDAFLNPRPAKLQLRVTETG